MSNILKGTELQTLIRTIVRDISNMHDTYYKEFAALEQEVRDLWDTPRHAGYTSMKELRHFSNDPPVKLLRSLTEYTKEQITDTELFPYLFKYPTLVKYYKLNRI